MHFFLSTCSHVLLDCTPHHTTTNIAMLLIDQYDVDVNVADDKGRTALFHVCSSQRESMAALKVDV